ncbi:hypothetical protein [Micromonospora sp. MA102]|uniref:hypothetical protein n=1 Tax=Micromonospora sp. MA102 TaxID=2952755 RepID=UPI0021C5FDE2|nr:hypothetical protein [Micromonospora sp. MA102]
MTPYPRRHRRSGRPCPPVRRRRRPKRRILIVGSAGAGKCTLARRLDLPLIHLDRHHRRPGWMPAGQADRPSDVAALTAGPAGRTATTPAPSISAYPTPTPPG